MSERRLIEPRTHAIRAYLSFDEHGLSPYWGFVSAYEPDQHERDFQFEALGTEWEVTNDSHWNGKLAPPPSANFDDEGCLEYKIKIEDRNTVDRDATIDIKPGFPDAHHFETGNPIKSLPDDLPRCIRIGVHSTNVGTEEIIPLVQAYLDATGVNPGYLDGDPHEYSRIVKLERYVRLDRDVYEEKVVPRGGVIQKLAEFSDKRPLVGEHSWNHKEVVGKHEEVRLDADTWRRLLDRDSQELGYSAKGYHPDKVRSESVDPEEDPLADPKVEVAYKKKWSDETVPWDERGKVLEETQTVLWNVLSWAGIRPDADRDLWTIDDYFSASGVVVDDPEIVSSPLDSLAKAREDSVVDQLASTNISDQQVRVLIALFDSESNHYKALADRADVGTSTIYRLIDSLSGLLKSMRGQIRFEDGIVRERVGGVVKRLKDISDWGRDRLRDAVDRVSAFQDGALQKWVERHGINVTQDGDRFEFDLGDGISRDEARQILRHGSAKVRVSDGIDIDEFRRSLVRFRTLEGTVFKALAFSHGQSLHILHA